MTIPYRGHTGQGTYFISASTYLKQNLLQTERMARLFLDVLQHYRTQGKYLLHEFVIMSDHFHLLITPGHDTTLEHALQLIKGGFSYRAKKELGVTREIWQRASTTAECGMRRNINGSGGTSTRIQYSEAWRDAHKNTHIALQIQISSWTKYLSG